ncbi:helix-turn-helix domain-containing protein [Parvularcula oceani]|uniref:helix-turn-helix domain-containing protein n=1 Tax=Parvularcula oceani TaxID=1247963 RepID=UPI0004E170FD|nr:XRE family transcriptional regulator [Parvularcula oceani]
MSLAVGFIADRLTEARRARGVTAADLAGMIDVSPTSISKYENGHQTPRRDVVDRMAATLRLPSDYFYRATLSSDQRPVFWRSKLSAQTGDLERAKVRLEWLKEMIDYLSSFFDYPALSLPIGEDRDALTIREDEIETLANTVRSFWSVQPGPLPDCVEKVEESGVLVSRIHVHAEKVDAFSQWSDRYDVPFIVLSRDKASAVRQRFDLLHELGHVLMHKNVTQKQMNNKATYKLIEGQADKFASYMLMPEQAFISELYAPTLDAMLSLKERWGVSVGAMIMRCKSLDLLDDASAKRLWMNYTRRGWRKGEPYDSSMAKEEPLLIRRGFEMLLSEGIQSVADIRKALPFPADDLEELADLESGTLGSSAGTRAEPVLKRKGIGDNVVSLFER